MYNVSNLGVKLNSNKIKEACCASFCTSRSRGVVWGAILCNFITSEAETHQQNVTQLGIWYQPLLCAVSLTTAPNDY